MINFILASTMRIKFTFLAILISFSFAKTHEYYLSTTTVRWVPEKNQLQFTSRFFLEDIEALMQEEVDPKVQFSPDSSKEAIDAFVSDFYTKNIAIMLAGEQHSLTFLGREYKDDLLVVYAELNPNKERFENLQINARFLVDFLPTQQNIFHIKTPDKRKSFLLTKKQNTLFYEVH